MYRSTRAEISLTALTENYNLVRRLVSQDQFFLPIVKANAYGHGDVEISALLRDKCGATCFGVGTIDEALRLRKVGIGEPIYLLGPVYDHDAIDELWNSKITPIVSDRVQFERLVEQKDRSWTLHLKFDTGMHRLGFCENDIAQIVEIKNKNPQISITGVCTHLYKSDDFGMLESCSVQQLKVFNSIKKKLSEQISGIKDWHLLNSDGVFSYLEFTAKSNVMLNSNLDADSKSGIDSDLKRTLELGARPGISLYGYSGFDSVLSHQLKPVMTLKTAISHLTKVSKGRTVSYNATWTAKRDSLIATLPIGYADGYMRSLSNKGFVHILNQKVPVIGIVCMDYIMIDVTDIIKKSELGIGTEVELFGKNVKLSEIASLAGTITYEILVRLGQRVSRKYY
jgi:alanine racemase